MTERRSQIRFVAYILGIVVLLFPVYWLSAPATTQRPGGKLAQLRQEYGLGQAGQGEVDPSSEAGKLLTLGLRGLAVNILWNLADDFKKKEDWTKFTATLDQLTKLQPHFITFWKYQSWNVSYNVSVEFDDYKDRYYYVRRGIDFLKQGSRYNENNPQLLWDIGWFIGQKIGRADEHVEYRQLFKADDDFHGEERRGEDRDNWLVASDTYDDAERSVDELGRDLEKKSPVIFYSSGPMALINYSDAIEDEGIHGDRARTAWINAGEAWQDYGDKEIRHSTGDILQLNSYESLVQEMDELAAQIRELDPELKDRMVEERKQALSERERAAMEIPVEKRTDEDYRLASEAERKIQVSYPEVALRIAEEHPEHARQARQLQIEFSRLLNLSTKTRQYRQTANFEYWRLRAQFEQTPEALRARELVYRAEKAVENTEFLKARQLFEDGFAQWAIVLDEFPIVSDDPHTGEDIVEVIKKYRNVLNQLDESLPDDFALWDVIEAHDTEGAFRDALEARQARLSRSQGSPGEQAGETPVESAADVTSEPAEDDDAKAVEPTPSTQRTATPSPPLRKRPTRPLTARQRPPIPDKSRRVRIRSRRRQHSAKPLPLRPPTPPLPRPKAEVPEDDLSGPRRKCMHTGRGCFPVDGPFTPGSRICIIAGRLETWQPE